MTPQPVLEPRIAGDIRLGNTYPGIAHLTTHLTAEQMTELLAGPAGAAEAGDLRRMRSPGQDGDAGSASASDPEQNAAFAEAHLLTCARCAAELAGLREGLSLFRQASIAYADSELRRRPQWTLPGRSILRPALEPAYWVAAAAMLLTALFPLQVLRQHGLGSPPAVATSLADHPAESQSDEALLADVNREVSASVPAPMQALADPTGDVSSVSVQTSPETSDPRKD